MSPAPSARVVITIQSPFESPRTVEATADVANMTELLEWYEAKLIEAVRTASMFAHWDHIDIRLYPPW